VMGYLWMKASEFESGDLKRLRLGFVAVFT
jgi:hypothetical protein